MSYVLILAILAVVVAPLLAVMPNKTQRRQAFIRERAREMGLRVYFRSLPEVPARYRFSPSSDLACYESSFPIHQQPSGRRLVYIWTEGGWHAVSGSETSPEWLWSLPEGVFLVMFSERSVCFFWDERGGVPALEQIGVAAASCVQKMT